MAVQDELTQIDTPVDRSIQVAGRRGRILRNIGKVVAFVVVLGLAAMFIFPLVWMVLTSLKTVGETYAVPIVWWPAHLKWSNYPAALKVFPFLEYAWNS